MTRIKPSRRPYSGVGPVVSWPNNIAVSRTTPNNQDNTSPHRPNEKVSSRPHLSSYRSAYPRHAPPIPNNKHQLPRHRLQRPIYRHKQRATAPPRRPNWTAIHKRLKEKKKAAFAADLKARGLTGQSPPLIPPPSASQQATLTPHRIRHSMAKLQQSL